jgi:hypothetical protein
MSIRALTTTAVAALGLTLLAAPAYAGNAHFIASKTGVSLSGSTLSVSFKEAGLESGSIENITARAHVDATYQCVNGGNNNPADPKKTTVSGELSNSANFPADRNGNVVGSLSLTVPATTDALTCPSGQTELLTAFTFSGLSLTDNTSGAFLAVAGSWSGGAPIGHGKG